jgi:hypothetical protein
MKKLFALLLCAGLVIGLCSVASATSIALIRGAVYLPPAQRTTVATSGAVTTVWTDATYLAPYINRVFLVSSECIRTIYATIEGSTDASHWAVVDGSSLASIATATQLQAKITDNPLPYWRVRACVGATSEAAGKLWVQPAMCTQ